MTDPANQKTPAPVQPDTTFADAVKQAEIAEPKTEKRGGVRPGAGRPEGLTAEKAKVKNLPQFPAAPIKQGLQSLFDLWSAAAKIEELALSEDEADLLSLPITQLQEYYFPGILPEIAGTWIMLIFATSRIIKPRIKIINKTRMIRRTAAEMKAVENKIEDVTGPAVHYKPAKGGLIHVVDTSEVVKTTPDKNKVTCNVCKELFKKSS